MGNLYETDRYLNEYLLFHYGSAVQICPFSGKPTGVDFHRRIIDECLKTKRFPSKSRALDVGCAVGRMTFELSRKVEFAVGIDYSQKFIRAAKRIQKSGRHSVLIKEEGDLFSRDTVHLPRNLNSRKRKVRFERGDASKIQKALFDVVTAINLIDRLPRPEQFLKQLSSLVLPGGTLILGSPYTWMSEYTPPSNWLGGYKRGKESQWTAVKIVQLLKSDFRLIKRRDFPFLIREHRRKYQWGVSEVLVFRRK